MYAGFEFKQALNSAIAGISLELAEAFAFAAFPVGGPGTAATQLSNSTNNSVKQASQGVASAILGSEDMRAARHIAREAVNRYKRIVASEAGTPGDAGIAADIFLENCRTAMDTMKITHAERRAEEGY